MQNNPKIIITKPIEQSTHLAALIKKSGGIPILFPTLKIIDPPNQQLLINAINQLSNFNIIIFISPTAVQKTMPLLQSINPHPLEHLHIMTVGSGTAKALKQFKINNIHHPQHHFGSEALLALPLLQNIKNKCIALFKGEGGRELITETLMNRGAIVTEVVTYQRIIPDGTPTQQLTEWQKSGIDIIICTSENSLNNLITLIGPEAKAWLMRQLLLVSSPRLIQIALSLGFIQPPLLANNASDEAILSALTHWRGTQHG